MGIGLGVLGLPPSVFWAMTPREFASAVRGRTGAGGQGRAPDRARLEAMMARYPDGAGAADLRAVRVMGERGA